MSLKPLADNSQELKILKERQRNIDKYGFLRAFKMDIKRLDEFNAYEKYEWERENERLGGNENE